MSVIKLYEAYAVDQLRQCVREAFQMHGEQAILLSLYHPGDPDSVPCPQCFAPGTLVRTDRGYSPIETIEVGDRVLTEDGTYRAVTQTMSRRHSGSAFQWRTRTMAEPVISTGEHPVWALRSDHSHRNATYSRDGKPFCSPSMCEPYHRTHKGLRGRLHEMRWTDVSELDERSWVSTRVPVEEVEVEQIRVPDEYLGPHRRGPRVFDVTEEFLWMIGMYLAEGSSGTRNISFGLHEDEVNYQQRLTAMFQSWGYTTRIERRGQHGVAVSVNSSVLAEWFPQWLGRGSHNKHLPSELMSLPSKLAMQVVMGVWCGGGYKKFRRVGQTSRVLALQLGEVIQRAGGQFTIHSELQSDKKDVYTTVWNREGSARKQLPGRWNFQGQEQLAGVVQHESINYEGVVYNLNVEGNHTYVVQNILVHNCGDDIYKSPELDCQSCFGTTFNGGVRYSMLLWALFTDQQHPEQLGARGDYRPDARNAQFEAFPPVREHDVIVRVEQWTSDGVPGEIRGFYELGAVTQRSVRTGSRFGQTAADIVGQKAAVSMLSENMRGITQYPIVGGTFVQSVQLEAATPTQAAQAVVEPDTKVIFLPLEIAPGGVSEAPGGGTGGGEAAFVFTQLIPATIWNITHNLGYEPAVSIMVNDEEVDADVVYPNENIAVITFNTPQAGIARLM